MTDTRRCPECGSSGAHDHPTDGVRSCNECAYCAGEARFEPTS